MSISLLLVPAVMAAATAVAAASGGKGGTESIRCQVQTRMRDQTLLAQALRATGAEVTAEPTSQVATWSDGVRGAFQRGADGTWSVHFTGPVTEEQAIDLVRSVDAAYGRQVQLAVLRRLRERAPGCGLTLESETVTEDASVQLVFTVDDRSEQYAVNGENA